MQFCIGIWLAGGTFTRNQRRLAKNKHGGHSEGEFAALWQPLSGPRSFQLIFYATAQNPTPAFSVVLLRLSWQRQERQNELVNAPRSETKGVPRPARSQRSDNVLHNDSGMRGAMGVPNGTPTMRELRKAAGDASFDALWSSTETLAITDPNEDVRRTTAALQAGVV